MNRSYGREPHQMRPLSIKRHVNKHAEGSVEICYGDTKVLCTASVTEGVPRFLKGTGKGWITAEYGMLPRSTGSRMKREAAAGKQSGRTVEISRLIGRSLRAAVDLSRLGEYTITLDCDVLQADGGTRTAAITGAMVALVDALNHLQRQQTLQHDPLISMVAAISVGITELGPVVDLDYQEDSQAQTDMNLIMDEHGQMIELQGTAEQGRFSRAQLNQMLDFGEQTLLELVAAQRRALAE